MPTGTVKDWEYGADAGLCQITVDTCYTALTLIVGVQYKHRQPREAVLAAACVSSGFQSSVTTTRAHDTGLLAGWTARLRYIGNESVPIQLAQCWFPGLAIYGAKMLRYFFPNEIHGSNFMKQHSETVTV